MGTEQGRRNAQKMARACCTDTTQRRFCADGSHTSNRCTIISRELFRYFRDNRAHILTTTQKLPVAWDYFSYNICSPSGPAYARVRWLNAAHFTGNPQSMKHHLLTVGSLAAFVVVSLSSAAPVGAQAVKRDTVPRAAQQAAPLRASVDSLVECSPVATPAKAKPAVRRRRAVAPARKATRATVAPKTKPRVTPKATAKPKTAARPRRPVARTVRRVTPAATRAVPVHSTTIVMCRPVRPIPALAQGTPTVQSVIPVPQLAASPPAPTVVEEGPPLLVSTAPGMPIATAGNGRSWFPFAVIPAVFIPFIHSGTTHHGNTPTDTTTTPPVIPPVTPPVTPPDTTPVIPPVIPPTDTIPTLPPNVPPTTVPEPGTLVMLGSGLLGLAAVMKRRRRK